MRTAHGADHRVPRRGAPHAFAALLSLALVGCAPAAPMLLGSRTTPRDRVDVGLGGAARIPVGELSPRDAGDEMLAFAEPGGLAPVGYARWGFVRHGSLGAFVTGSTLRLELHGEARLSTFLRLAYGIMPYGGYAWSGVRQGTPGGEGWRVGALAPLAISFDAGGVIEGWLGIRAGFEQAEGMVGMEGMRAAGNLSAFRGGGFVGIAAGLRRLHVLAELAVDYEYWRGSLGGVAIERQGAVFTPGFALRIRF
jgi:hypothetical protein